jgi:hypothetical protein
MINRHTGPAAVGLAERTADTEATLIGSRCRRSPLETSRELLVWIRDTKPVSRIVGPAFTVDAAIPVAVAAPVTVKSMAVEEVVVDEYRTAEPVRSPAPTVPAAPEA